MSKQSYRCGVAAAMNVLGGKWKLNILWALSKSEVLRFNALKREVKGITNIMLTRSLETLMSNDLVVKRDFQTIPSHTEYALTKKGKELIPFLTSLNDWGTKNLIDRV